MDSIASTLTNTSKQINDFRVQQAYDKLRAEQERIAASSQENSSLTNFQPERVVEEGANGSLDKDDFLKILVTQLQNQDPSQPMEDKEFISQMAQFSSLEQITNMSRGFEEMSKSAQRNYTLSLIGKQVQLLPANAEPVEGVVSEVTTGAESKVKINGVMYDSKDIIKVSTVEVQ